LRLSLKLGWYLFKQRLRSRKYFPLTMILEPLEACNLTCSGCGRIREYEPILDRRLTVEECLWAVEECDAPVVSIAGGEPLMHPHIGDIAAGIIRQKRFVYLCTNALLYKQAMKVIKPSPYFSFVVHLDGLRETHDIAVEREGVYDVAIEAIQDFRQSGFRVCTNTTLYSGTGPEEYHELFAMLNDMGVEGMMVSPGFQYKEVAHHDIFLQRYLLAEGGGQLLLPSRLRGVQGRHPLLQQPAVPGLPPGPAAVPVQPVDDPHLHTRRLAEALLPAGRRPRPNVQGADGDHRLGGLRMGPRPPLRHLHDALRL